MKKDLLTGMLLQKNGKSKEDIYNFYNVII